MLSTFFLTATAAITGIFLPYLVVLFSHSKLRCELRKIKKDLNQHGVDFEVRERFSFVTIEGLLMSKQHMEDQNRGFLC